MPSAASGPLLRGARRLLGVLQSFVGFGSWISGDVGLASVFCWVRAWHEASTETEKAA